MERRARFRIGLFVTLILAVMALFTFRLYKLQTAQNEESLREADAITYQTTVKASRGELLDRNGTVLVTNRASYNVMIIHTVFFSQKNQDLNQSVLNLLNLCDQLGIEPITTFPVTSTRPYAYTLDETSSVYQDYFRRFLRSRGWDTDITAQTLVHNLRRAYEIPDDWPEEDVYRVISVRYEISLRAVDNMPLDNYTLAEDVSPEALAAIVELGIPGVIVETATVREYKTPYAAHILGHTGDMSLEEYQGIYKEQGYPMNAVVGREGVELAFEEYLHGVDGVKQTTITADGEILSQTYLSVPQPGANVELTIDIDLQAVAEEALERVILDLRENGVGTHQEGTDAEGGAVVAMDVKTGEVLVCASYPTYDLSTYHEDFNQLNEDVYKPMYNRALLGTYPPGSIYKMVTAITGVDYASWGRYAPVTDEGRYTKYEEYGYTPACYIYTSTNGAATHGTVNMMEAISVSCNYYFYEVGLAVATKDVDYVAMKLGLGEPTGIELAENTGTRANEETKAEAYYGTDSAAWNEGDKLQSAIGQGLNAFTPMQMACYTAALANDGTRYSATFLRRVVSWDFQELLEENSPEIADQLEISEEALLAYHEGMVMAATDTSSFNGGTAQKYLHDLPYTVAAKTGTAQHGSGGSDNASFVCFAPAEDPQIAIAIYVEKGAQGGNLGQIARAILEAYFSQESKYETTSGENVLN